jgi:aconitate hydratase
MVLAKSFARIHRSNLINSGIIPLIFEKPADADDISQGDKLTIEDAPDQVLGTDVRVRNEANGHEYAMKAGFSESEKAMLLAGGRINWLKAGSPTAAAERKAD